MFFVEVSVQILHLWEKKELFSVLYLTFEFSSYKFFFNYMIWKYFLLVYDFLKSLTCLFQRKKIKSSCLFFVSFYEWYFWCQHVRTHYLTRDDKAFHIFVIFHFVIILCFAYSYISLRTHFELLRIMLPWTSEYKFSCGYMFSCLLHAYQRVEFLGHKITLCLTFWGTVKLFSKELYHFTFPSVMCENSASPHLHQQSYCLSFWILAILLGMM